MTWWVTAAGHGVIVLAYVWIAWFVGRGLSRSGQWRTNPLGVATFAIFTTCAVGHGVHVEHALLVDVGIEPEIGMAARTALADPVLVLWTLGTAAVGAWYFSKRSRLEIVHGGAALCEDLVSKQAQAERIQAGVGNKAQQARALLRQGDHAAAATAAHAALEEAKRTSAMLMGKPGQLHAVRPGDLRR